MISQRDATRTVTLPTPEPDEELSGFDGDLCAARERLRGLAEVALASLNAHYLNNCAYHFALALDNWNRLTTNYVHAFSADLDAERTARAEMRVRASVERLAVLSLPVERVGMGTPTGVGRHGIFHGSPRSRR
jgi:hypothetical protein